MKTKTLLLAVLMGCASALSAQTYKLNYKLINNENYPTNDLAVATYDAVECGVDNTGATDCTTQLQNLLDKVAGVGTKTTRGYYANTTGGILYLPAGTYLCSGKLVIPRGVTLRGDWKKPVKGQTIGGTIIKVTQGKNETDINNAFITMQPTSEISNIAFWYPEQTGSTVYSPTILMGQADYWGNDYCNVRHVTLVNSWIGIQFNYNNGGGCPNIFDVYGTPLYKGIEMDELADVGRFDWIDFAADYWAGSGLAGAPGKAAIESQLKSQAIGFVMRRNDWSYLCNYSCDGYQVGYMATKSVLTSTTPNGQCYNLKLSNCGIGMQIQATSYAGYMYSRVSTPGCEVGVQVEGGTVGPSEFYACELAGSQYAVHTTSSNSAAVLLQDCTVSGATLIEGGQFSADNSTFGKSVTIGPLARTIFTGNSFSSGSLVNNSIFKCVVDNATKNGGKSLPAFGEDYMTIKDAKPSRKSLYVVTSTADNTLYPFTISEDPTTQQDSKPVIQYWLNKAGSEGGGIVYLPAGHYRCNGNLSIPKGVELKGAGDLASVPKGHGTILECIVNEGKDESNGVQPFIQMSEGSGLRGITINYPKQKSPTDVKKYPYTIRGNKSCYIVNVSMRAAYRGVDLFTNDCSGHYVDYLAGHAFMNVIRVGGGSKDGVISNIQCNTIAYACGYESKFGSWPNSLEANKGNCYGQNMEHLDFMIIGDCDGEVLYNNFLYGCANGMIFQKDSNGKGASNLHSMGNAVDGAVNTFVFNGASGDIDLINSQVVALNNGYTAIDASANRDAHFVSTGTEFDKTVNFFASCHWGGGNYFANVQGGTVNFLLFNSSKLGNISSMTTANGTKVKIHNGYVNGITKLANTSGTDEPRMSITSSYCTPTGAATGSMSKWQNNLPMAWEMGSSDQLISRTGWVASANKNDGNAYKAIDGDASTRWDTSGSQTNGQQFQVNFNKSETFNTVILDAASSSNDGPAAYTVEVSTDGTNWKQVATGENAGALLIVTFDAVTAQYVRVTQTSTGVKTGYWSIHEFNIANLDLDGSVVEESPYTTLTVPGTIQAEDFNSNGYSFAQPGKATTSYRTDAKVAIQTKNGVTWIGDTQAKDYFNYTFTAAKAGKYNIKVYASSEGQGRYTMSIDGTEIVANESPANTKWETFTEAKTIENVALTAGEHKLVFTVNVDVNIDKFVFELVEAAEPTNAFTVNGTATIQAEDFNGDYNFYNAETKGNNDYRTDAKIATATNGTDRWIGDTHVGDYFEYVMNVTKRGCYKINVFSGCGNAGGGAFKLSFDGGEDESYTTANGSWTAMSSGNVNKDIYVYLSEGEHTMKFTVVSDLNIDRFAFDYTTADPEMKVIGTLNSHDIEEIHKSTAVTKIDLSEAKFEADADGYSYGSHEEKGASVAHHTAANTITQYMFDGMSSLTEVKLPESITTIQSYAFRGTGLTTLTVPDNVATINSFAFAGIDGTLESVQLPQGITNLPYGMFQNTKIRNIVVPASVKTIDNWAYGSSTSQNVTQTLTFGEGSQLESIGTVAFKNLSGISEVVFPSTLKTLGDAAFASCTSLTSVTLPISDGTSIGNIVFENCKNLTTLTLDVNTTDASKFNVAANTTTTETNANGELEDKTTINDPFADVTPNHCEVVFDVASGKNRADAIAAIRDKEAFLRLLTKTMDEATDYDVCQQEAADVVLTRSFVQKWNTIVLPFALSGTQMRQSFGNDVVAVAFTGVRGTGDQASLQFTGVSKMEQQTPYIIRLEDGEAGLAIDQKNYHFVNVDLPAKEQVLGSNGVAEVAYGNYTFTGVYQTVNNIAATSDALYIKSNAFYLRQQGNGTTGLRGFRAYFRVNGVSTARLNIVIDGDATDIGVVDIDEEGGPMDVYSVSGQLIRRAARDLNGLPQGIYVVNGKKVRK